MCQSDPHRLGVWAGDSRAVCRSLHTVRGVDPPPWNFQFCYLYPLLSLLSLCPNERKINMKVEGGENARLTPLRGVGGGGRGRRRALLKASVLIGAALRCVRRHLVRHDEPGTRWQGHHRLRKNEVRSGTGVQTEGTGSFYTIYTAWRSGCDNVWTICLAAVVDGFITGPFMMQIIAVKI